MESFNPSPEHKKVEDLPKGRQGEFVDVEGGFVRKDAMEHLEYAEASAQKHNELKHRSLLDRVLGKNKQESVDSILEWHAKTEDTLRKTNDQ